MGGVPRKTGTPAPPPPPPPPPKNQSYQGEEGEAGEKKAPKKPKVNFEQAVAEALAPLIDRVTALEAQVKEKNGGEIPPPIWSKMVRLLLEQHNRFKKWGYTDYAADVDAVMAHFGIVP